MTEYKSESQKARQVAQLNGFLKSDKGVSSAAAVAIQAISKAIFISSMTGKHLSVVGCLFQGCSVS